MTVTGASTINNTAIGGTTAAAGAFTTLSASSTVSGTGFSTYLASPPAIGGTAAAAGTFTTLSGTTSVTTPIVKSASSLTLQTNGTTTAVTVDTSQNVGIGTSSPSCPLNVVSASSSLAIAINGRSSDSLGAMYFYANNGSTQYATITTAATEFRFSSVPAAAVQTFYTNGAERVRINASGIVTMSAYGAGAATFSAAGVISSVSDETWKIKDGVPIDTDSMLNKLQPGYWYYNDEKKETFGADRQLGFYAQNVNAAIGPEAAPVPEEGKPWGYYDRSVLAVTVMSLQKALATIESLTARIAALEAK
jgi:hypothetical protein